MEPIFANDAQTIGLNALQAVTSASMLDRKQQNNSMLFHPYSTFHANTIRSACLRSPRPGFVSGTPFGINDILNRPIGMSGEHGNVPLTACVPVSTLDSNTKLLKTMNQESMLAQAAAMYLGRGINISANSDIQYNKALADHSSASHPIYWPGVTNDDWQKTLAVNRSQSAITLENQGRKKHTRPTFSGQQIFVLEKTFEQNKYLAGQERARLAYALAMTESQVKVWFQNRRTKWRKRHAAEMATAKKLHDCEVTLKIKERERESNEYSEDASPDETSLSSRSPGKGEESDVASCNHFETTSDTVSNPDYSNEFKTNLINETNDAKSDDVSNKSPSHLPLLQTSAEERNSKLGKDRLLKSMLFSGLYKLQGHQCDTLLSNADNFIPKNKTQLHNTL